MKYSDTLQDVKKKDEYGNEITVKAYTYTYLVNKKEYKEGDSFSVSTSGSGTDIFGNATSTDTTITFLILRGKLVTTSTHSVTTGTDVLGNSTITDSTTTNHYDWKNGFYVLTSIDTTTSSRGSDLYGGTWH